MPFGPWPGSGGGGGGGGAPLDYMEIHGDELMIINNADWPVNSNAPTESDSNNAAWKIARYDQLPGATGRGFRRRVFPLVDKIILGVELRGDGVAVSADAQFTLYWRVIDPATPAAVPAWQFFIVPLFVIRADAFHVEYQTTITVGAAAGEIDLDEGLNQFELVRNGEDDVYAASLDVGVVSLQQDPAP